MATWTNSTKNTATWSNVSKADVFGGPGYATGTLGMTYYEAVISTTWTNLSKNTPTWSQPTKN